MKHSTFAQITALFGTVAVWPSPAWALEPKQCLKMAEMNTALVEDGQRTIVTGDHEILFNPTGKVLDASVLKNLEAVTSNQEGTLGYQLSGNKPKSQISTTVCVAAKLTDIRLFDNSMPGIPRDTFLGGQFDQSLRSNEKLGTKPMVLANTVHLTTDGKEHLGLPMMILGNPDAKSGFIVTRMPDGKMQGIAQMADTDFTAEGRKRVLSVNPPK